MIRKIIMTLALVFAVFVTAEAQNSIDNLVEKYSAVGNSKFTSAVERNPKTRAVVKVVKVLEMSGWVDVSPFVNAFKAESKNGNFSESYDDDDMTLMLTTNSGSRNRIYMLKATDGMHSRKGMRYQYTKITIIIKYR